MTLKEKEKTGEEIIWKSEITTLFACGSFILAPFSVMGVGRSVKWLVVHTLKWK